MKIVALISSGGNLENHPIEPALLQMVPSGLPNVNEYLSFGSRQIIFAGSETDQANELSRAYSQFVRASGYNMREGRLTKKFGNNRLYTDLLGNGLAQSAEKMGWFRSLEIGDHHLLAAIQADLSQALEDVFSSLGPDDIGIGFTESPMIEILRNKIKRERKEDKRTFAASFLNIDFVSNPDEKPEDLLQFDLREDFLVPMLSGIMFGEDVAGDIFIGGIIGHQVLAD